jgi:hypothetical protein
MGVKQNIPFSIGVIPIQVAEQSPEVEHLPLNDRGTEESAQKGAKEVSRHHTRLMLMQKQSKRLILGNQDEEFIDTKNEIELA